MSFRILALLLLSSVLIQFSGEVYGAILQFSTDNGTTFDNTVNTPTNTGVTIQVFLNDSGDTTLADQGLLGFGLRVAASPSNLGMIDNGVLNPVFEFTTTNTVTPSSVDWATAVFLNPPPNGPSVFLGSFDFTPTADGSTVLSFGDIQPGSGSVNANWSSGTGTVLDEVIFGPNAANTFSLTINSTAVPEPTVAPILGLALACMAQRRRRTTL